MCKKHYLWFASAEPENRATFFIKDISGRSNEVLSDLVSEVYNATTSVKIIGGAFAFNKRLQVF
jgi:hypothetical protein